jgi:dCMP deaminase
VDQNRNPRGFGYNGMPRGLDDHVPERSQPPLKNWLYEHAERNVIYSASRIGIPIEGCWIFTTHFPCVDCARAIVQSGLKCVTVDSACMVPDSAFYRKWKDQIAVSK